MSVGHANTSHVGGSTFWVKRVNCNRVNASIAIVRSEKSSRDRIRLIMRVDRAHNLSTVYDDQSANACQVWNEHLGFSSGGASVRIMGEAGRPLIDNYRSLILVSLADGRRDRRARDLSIPIRCETTHCLKVFCGGTLSDLEISNFKTKLLWYWIRLWTRSSLFISFFKFYVQFSFMQIVYCYTET